MMLLGVYLLVAIHLSVHACVFACLCVFPAYGSDAPLSVNWLAVVTMATVLWKSSLPAAPETPPVRLNVIFACCLHINWRCARSPLSNAWFYWLMFYACFISVSYFESHVDTKGIVVAVPPS